MKEAIFFCMVGLPHFGKESSVTPVFKILAELSETQNYAYWDANFSPGTHGFHQARVPRTHVFLVGTCQKSSGWEINAHQEIKAL